MQDTGRRMQDTGYREWVMGLVLGLVVCEMAAGQVAPYRASGPDRTAGRMLESTIDAYFVKLRNKVAARKGKKLTVEACDHAMAEVVLDLCDLLATNGPHTAEIRKAGIRHVRSRAWREKEAEARAAICIVANLCGERVGGTNLVTLAKGTGKPELRSLALLALGRSRDPGPALALVPLLGDPTELVPGDRLGRRLGKTKFPVRKSAAVALRRIGLKVEEPAPDEFKVDEGSVAALRSRLAHIAEMKKLSRNLDGLITTKQYDVAIKRLDGILAQTKDEEVVPSVLLKKVICFYRMRRLEDAAAACEKIVREYAESEHADKAASTLKRLNARLGRE